MPWDDLVVLFAFVQIFIGVILLISGFITPIVSESKTGMGLAIFLILGAILTVAGAISVNSFDEIGMPLYIGGMVISLLIFLAWPCVCCQGSQGIKSQVVGVASAHDSISMTELSNKTGASVKLSSEIVYDAIGKGQLSGRMEGDTFIRSAPSSAAYSGSTTTTKEREIVKVLVICPYCGAKTEQGIGKCQNCQADL